ncbi:MAG: RibD family protein [Phototrophicaceae bacterium]
MTSTITVTDFYRPQPRGDGLPFVTVSYAQSLDGCLASHDHRALALSGHASMTLTHAIRASHDAILVGVQTVLSDDPMLTVRWVEGENPQPVVLDSRLRFPPSARLLTHPRGVWVATVTPPPPTLAPALTVLQTDRNPNGQVDLLHVLQQLGERGIRSVMVEGGATVIASFLQARLVNRVIVTLTPRYFGGVGIAHTLRTATPIALPHPQCFALGEDFILWSDLA